MNRAYALPPSDARPWTVCFYSFRGGVGRTTLAVSTALGIAGQPWTTYLDGTQIKSKDRAVALLDLDLEAPGLHAFRELGAVEGSQPGFADYIREYWDSRCTVAPAIDRYVYRVGDFMADEYVKEQRSRLFVMRAGRLDDTYQKFLGDMDWTSFYRWQGGGALLEDLRAGLRTEFGCRTLIVDSRTGFSEVGGVALGHLADAVVIVFQPTKAHTDGLKAVVAAIKEREACEQRVIPRLYVASKVMEVFEGAEHPHQVQLAFDVVAECESVASVTVVGRQRLDEMFGGMEYEEVTRGGPTVVIVPSRPQVPNPQTPDAFVIPGFMDPSRITNHRAYPYVYVTEWLELAKNAVILSLALRSELVRLIGPSGHAGVVLSLMSLRPWDFVDATWNAVCEREEFKRYLKQSPRGSFRIHGADELQYGALLGYLSECPAEPATKLLAKLQAEFRELVEGS